MDVPEQRRLSSGLVTGDFARRIVNRYHYLSDIEVINCFVLYEFLRQAHTLGSKVELQVSALCEDEVKAVANMVLRMANILLIRASRGCTSIPMLSMTDLRQYIMMNGKENVMLYVSKNKCERNGTPCGLANFVCTHQIKCRLAIFPSHKHIFVRKLAH